VHTCMRVHVRTCVHACTCGLSPAHVGMVTENNCEKVKLGESFIVYCVCVCVCEIKLCEHLLSVLMLELASSPGHSQFFNATYMYMYVYMQGTRLC
jgi:hypothetical protein